ncbi:MAG: hypothetical protein HYS13_06995 [Planctomycetia bacterium]|nr:hypothetical protein [Planctomycetia bacterium]
MTISIPRAAALPRWAATVPAILLFLAAGAVHADEEAEPQASLSGLRAVLVSPELVTAENLKAWQSAKVSDAAPEPYNAVVLELRAAKNNKKDDRSKEDAAARLASAAGLQLFYWIEVARCPELADAHPEWIASLQGHPEWRRFYPKLQKPGDDEVVKNYPWVPVFYKESFAAQLTRVSELLSDRPAAKGVFLNDVQAAPSACGCGSILCRWVADYGPIKTATPLSDDAPAQFVAAVKKAAPNLQVVPVWTTECEEHDAAKDGMCAGVGCFDGLCWKHSVAQLSAVQKECPTLAALLPYRLFQRDLPLYGEKAGWVRVGIESLAKMPARHKGEPIPASRVVAVLQGWDAGPDDLAAQMARAREAKAAGYIVSLVKIEQSWEPRIVNRGVGQ